jgi:sugar lactone lactonase YvrE
MVRRLLRLLFILGGVVVTLALCVFIVFGGGRRLDDRTNSPALQGSALERVVDLDYPPGNIAVSRTGRVFFTLHPDGRPPLQVVELKDGEIIPYPDETIQRPVDGQTGFQSVLSMRIDRQDRLWVLDFANFGTGQPRILAFDLSTDKLIHQYDFPRSVAGYGSMLNDFQVGPNGDKIYIAEASPILHTPAIIVYDTIKKTSRRLLHKDWSVTPRDYIIQAPGRDMVIFGIYTMRIGIDSIGLDARGEWLYYGPVSGDRMYRVRTADLNDATLAADVLARRVEDYGPKTLSDGITLDTADNIYISDMEHSAILTLNPERQLTTILKDPRLRWPDGFSFGPDGWLYVTCSSLQHVLFVPKSRMVENAPYQIFRFRPGPTGIPGH